jgi:hypothetical protein
VPTKYEEVPKLGSWVRTQRRFFKNGWLDPKRKTRLDTIGFEFKAREKTWNWQFKKLRAFKESHGHCEWFGAVDRFYLHHLDYRH